MLYVHVNKGAYQPSDHTFAWFSHKDTPQAYWCSHAAWGFDAQTHLICQILTLLTGEVTPAEFHTVWIRRLLPTDRSSYRHTLCCTEDADKYAVLSLVQKLLQLEADKRARTGFLGANVHHQRSSTKSAHFCHWPAQIGSRSLRQQHAKHFSYPSLVLGCV